MKAISSSFLSTMRIPQNKRGSALVTTLIFTGVLGAIIFPSYLKLTEVALDLSNRNFYSDAAFELAESGLEHAVWALNADYDGDSPWSSWTTSGSDIYTTIDGFTYTGGIVGSVEVRILDYTSDNPKVLTRGTIDFPGKPSVHRYMQAQFSSSALASTGGGLFAYGMLARDTITASGGSAFDSWNSDPDNDPSTPSVPYSAGVRDDNVKIASASTDNNAISLGSSDVYGSAAIGSDSYSGINVGWGGQVGPRDSSEWDPIDTTDLWMKDPPGWKVSTATGALTTGFTATFEDVSVPEEVSPTVTPAYTLPRTEQVLYSNQWSSWYQNQYVDTETIGEDGVSTQLQMDSLSVSGGATLTIRGDVTLVLPQSGINTFQVIQGGSLVLADGANLTIYTAGNTEISGAGLVNQGAPKNLQLWGTGENQTITFQGSGELSGVIYAPNADITLPGGTDLYGAVVGNAITMSGSGSFHYDESLVSLEGTSSGQAPAGGKRVEVQYVEEISSAEHSSQASS
jgi:hypothetical protein